MLSILFDKISVVTLKPYMLQLFVWIGQTNRFPKYRPQYFFFKRSTFHLSTCEFLYNLISWKLNFLHFYYGSFYLASGSFQPKGQTGSQFVTPKTQVPFSEYGRRVRSRIQHWPFSIAVTRYGWNSIGCLCRLLEWRWPLPTDIGW
jgi:hypothetical protein